MDGHQDRPADHHLAEAVAGSGAVVVCQVLSGLGGVGKTQLAAGLADPWWQERRVDLLVWVTATSHTRIVTTYAQAASEVTGFEEPDPERGTARFWRGC